MPLVYKTVQRDVTVLDDAICNKCGTSAMVDIKNLYGDGVVRREPYGLHSTYRGGFHSPGLKDNEEYDWYLCEPCLAEMFKTFKIPVRAPVEEV